MITLALWWRGGFDRGWTRTRVPRDQVDPGTGTIARLWENRFVPGVDFLAGGALASTLLVGSSCFCRKSPGELAGTTS